MWKDSWPKHLLVAIVLWKGWPWVSYPRRQWTWHQVFCNIGNIKTINGEPWSDLGKSQNALFTALVTTLRFSWTLSTCHLQSFTVWVSLLFEELLVHVLSYNHFLKGFWRSRCHLSISEALLSTITDFHAKVRFCINRSLSASTNVIICIIVVLLCSVVLHWTTISNWSEVPLHHWSKVTTAPRRLIDPAKDFNYPFVCQAQDCWVGGLRSTSLGTGQVGSAEEGLKQF